jgi:hypothetical protein
MSPFESAATRRPAWTYLPLTTTVVGDGGCGLELVHLAGSCRTEGFWTGLLVTAARIVSVPTGKIKGKLYQREGILDVHGNDRTEKALG